MNSLVIWERLGCEITDQLADEFHSLNRDLHPDLLHSLTWTTMTWYRENNDIYNPVYEPEQDMHFEAKS